MASIVLLLSELLGGESASVLAAERYMGGHRSMGEFCLQPAVLTDAPTAKQGQRRLVVVEDQTETARVREDNETRKEEPFEDLDLAVSRIAVDIMWP